MKLTYIAALFTAALATSAIAAHAPYHNGLVPSLPGQTAIPVLTPLPQPPITMTGDGIVLVPSGATIEIRDGATETVTPDGVLVTGGTIVIHGGSALISPTHKKDPRDVR